MRLTSDKLRGLIKETLLLELFNSLPYSFNFEPHVVDDPEEDFVAMSYNFTTDDGDIYLVAINSFGPDDSWDVMFRLAGGDYVDLTGKFDMRVYATVASIVRDFVDNKLPNLKNESMRKLRRFKVEPLGGFEGDTRRARVYYRILKNFGIDAEVDMSGEDVLLSFTV